MDWNVMRIVNDKIVNVVLGNSLSRKYIIKKRRENGTIRTTKLNNEKR